MKKLLIALVTLLNATSAMAHMPTKSDSWSTIKKHFAKVKIVEPSVKLDNGPMTPAFFICKVGDQLKTLKKLTKCVSWRNVGNRDRDRRVCTEEVEYFGYAAIEGTRERCVKYRRIGNRDRDRRVCVQYETYDYTLPLSHEVAVHKQSNRNRDNNRLGRKLFTKTLSIEDCE